MKQFIYIDDSGDPGLSPTSSSNFIIAAVILTDETSRDRLAQTIEAFQKSLGWKNGEELKFHKTRKDIICQAIQSIHNCHYSIYAIAIDKSHLPPLSLVEKSSIFLFTIKELLLHIAKDNTEIIIDGTHGPKYLRKARPYLRQSLKDHNIQTSKIIFANSKSDPLIQLADLAAGSVARSLSAQADAQKYLKLFGKRLKKIYRP